jgi:hypothetical protein
VADETPAEEARRLLGPTIVHTTSERGAPRADIEALWKVRDAAVMAYPPGTVFTMGVYYPDSGNISGSRYDRTATGYRRQGYHRDGGADHLARHDLQSWADRPWGCEPVALPPAVVAELLAERDALARVAELEAAIRRHQENTTYAEDVDVTGDGVAGVDDELWALVASGAPETPDPAADIEAGYAAMEGLGEPARPEADQ